MFAEVKRESLNSHGMGVRPRPIELGVFDKEIGGDGQGFRPHFNPSDTLANPLDQSRGKGDHSFSDSMDEPEFSGLSENFSNDLQLRTLCLWKTGELLMLNSSLGQGDAQHFIHMFDGHEVDLFSNVDWEIDEVFLIQVWNDDIFNFVSERGKGLFL